MAVFSFSIGQERILIDEGLEFLYPSAAIAQYAACGSTADRCHAATDRFSAATERTKGEKRRRFVAKTVCVQSRPLNSTPGKQNATKLPSELAAKRPTFLTGRILS